MAVHTDSERQYTSWFSNIHKESAELIFINILDVLHLTLTNGFTKSTQHNFTVHKSYPPKKSNCMVF